MLTDDIGQWGDVPLLCDAIAEVVPEGDAELAAGLLQTGEAIAAAFAQIAAGAAADLAPLHVASDVAFAAVGMQDDVRAFEHQQQLLLVRVQPLEGLVESGKGGALGEDGVEARRQLGGQRRIGMAPIGLEVGIEIPVDGVRNARFFGEQRGESPARAVNSGLGDGESQKVMRSAAGRREVTG